jgi:aldehyde dehydrogenase (NAD+)
LFIDNRFVNAADHARLEVLDPTTGKIITEISSAGAEDVDMAVDAAKRAFLPDSEWRRMDASERGRLLNKLADAMERDLHYIASLETLDNGKPIAASYWDVDFSIKTLRYYAGLADKVHGLTIPADGDVFAYTRSEPIGVCAQIIPWNFPLLMASWKIGPALAAGNTVILKPAENTPLTALYLARLTLEVGFPSGVVNVLPGLGSVAGETLARHPGVDKVAFTGSTAIGKRIQSICSEAVKRCTLELGGKSPLVICADANVQQAAQIAHDAVFINQGQCCAAGSRTFVHRSLYDRFVEAAVELAKNRTVGDPFDEQTQQGPQVSRQQMDKILDLVQSGRSQGASLLHGGQRHGDQGFFVQPTVFGDVTDEMRVAQEEIFGPVQQIFKFDTLDEVIERSNSSIYGLASGIVTNDIEQSQHFIQRVRSLSLPVSLHTFN